MLDNGKGKGKGKGKGNRKEVIEILIAAGADINARDEWENTPLHKMAESGNAEAVKYLIGKGADINAKNKLNNLALHVIRSNTVEVIKVLIAAGTDINARGHTGNTALYIYAERGETKAVKSLLNNGAEVDTMCFFKKTPLAVSANVEIAQILINAGADISGDTSLFFTPLHSHVHKNRIELVKLLLDNGVDINIRNEQDKHALHLAVSVDMVETFASRGVELRKIKTDQNFTLLHAYAGNVELLKYLVSKNAFADINTADQPLGNTPLFYAIKSYKTAPVEFLIKQGADVNHKSKQGTPLDCAIKLKHKDTIELLKKHGAIASPKQE